MSDDMEATQPAPSQRTVIWLMLPAVFILFELMMAALQLPGLRALKEGGVAEGLVPQGVDVQDPAWIRLVDYQWNMGIFTVCALAALLILLFTRSWLFPGAFVAFWGLNLLLKFFDVMQVHSVAGLEGHGSYTELMRPIIFFATWASLYLKQQNTRSIFTRSWPVARLD